MAISIAQTKEILKRPDMSDEEAEYIRDGFRSLAEIIYEKWMVDVKTTPQPNLKTNNKQHHERNSIHA